MVKLAVVIGINYRGTSNELKGCINDALALKKMLVEEYKYQEKNITLLTDDTTKKPSGANIIQCIYELALRSQKENVEEIWISYSGHGSSIRDTSGDEKDGRDEVIIPVDYATAGVVVDDLLNHVLSFIEKKTKVIALFDCCHSGTILDLPYKYISGDTSTRECDVNNVAADVIMISGCRDDQTSADAYNLEKDGKFSGAMTSSFLETMEEFNYDITVFKLLEQMRTYLSTKGYSQIPQVTCTFPVLQTTAFAINKKNYRRPFLEKP